MSTRGPAGWLPWKTLHPPARRCPLPDDPTPAVSAPLGDAPPSAWGWDAAVEHFAHAQRERGAATGRVMVVSRGFDTVRLGDGREVLTDRSTAAFRSAALASPPAVGDWVAVSHDGSTPAIVAVAPRHGVIVRRDPADRVSAQVVAANIDTAFCVFGLDRELRPRRVERVLVLVHEGGATPVVVLTKHDLADPGDEETEARVAMVRDMAAEVAVFVVSSHSGAGMEALSPYLRPGQTVALLGESGAGKSSLVNALVGLGHAEVGAVRDRDRRGRHTTTARRMFLVPDGGTLVDTPGLRALGLWEGAEGVEEAFADVVKLALDCRFRDCRHHDEPGCAVRAAVRKGKLVASRLAAYRSLRVEVDTVEAKKEAGRRLRGEGRRPPLRRSRRRAGVDDDEEEAGPDDDQG